jgi:hypothetical protein
VWLREDGRAIGTAQATIVGDEASLAWVIGAGHPNHAASNAVARSLGLAPTDELDDGEIVWRSLAH